MGYRLHWESRGVVKEFFGTVTGACIMHSLADVHGSPEFDTLRFVVNDFSAVTAFDLSDFDPEYVAALDGAASMTNKRINVAIVATAPAIIEAAEQYARTPLNTYPTKLFTDMASARTWAEAAPNAPNR